MTTPLKVVLCWHMHQPLYKHSNGPYQQPWTYLHALKDYSDMAAHLEDHPQMRCVVNFTPILLEQLQDYADRIQAHLTTGQPIGDSMLDTLAGTQPIPDATQARADFIQQCLRAHAPRMIEPYAPYRELLRIFWPKGWDGMRSKPDLHIARYLNDAYCYDLLFWYHLAWVGHSLRTGQDTGPIIQTWTTQAHGFSHKDRRQLLSFIGEQIAAIVPRYKALAERGQIELSTSPYSHPILPLLIDFQAMRCAQADAPAPEHSHYPDGQQRAQRQLQHGLDIFQQHFGFRPQGIWPSEGSLSEATVALLDQQGIAWTASGEGLWHSSRALSQLEHQGEAARRSLFSPHQLPDTNIALFFRDDGLSDMIGFEYQSWDADQAADAFLQHLRNIATFLGEEHRQQHLVSIILDGENAWEYYPDNGYHFLRALYQRLTEAPDIEATTYSDALPHCPPQALPKLCAGSWVYGSFSTWIGERDKNRAWDLLTEAKHAYDQALAEGRLSEPQAREAEHQLAICEGSDWFWWFGDYNPNDSVQAFDQLYREQLRQLYRLLQQTPPDSLQQPLSSPRDPEQTEHNENAGTMRRGGP